MTLEECWAAGGEALSQKAAAVRSLFEDQLAKHVEQSARRVELERRCQELAEEAKKLSSNARFVRENLAKLEGAKLRAELLCRSLQAEAKQQEEATTVAVKEGEADLEDLQRKFQSALGSINEAAQRQREEHARQKMGQEDLFARVLKYVEGSQNRCELLRASRSAHADEASLCEAHAKHIEAKVAETAALCERLRREKEASEAVGTAADAERRRLEQTLSRFEGDSTKSEKLFTEVAEQAAKTEAEVAQMEKDRAKARRVATKMERAAAADEAERARAIEAVAIVEAEAATVEEECRMLQLRRAALAATSNIPSRKARGGVRPAQYG